MQKKRDLYEAQALQVPFSNDYYSTRWGTAAPARVKSFKKNLARLVAHDIEEAEYSSTTSPSHSNIDNYDI